MPTNHAEHLFTKKVKLSKIPPIYKYEVKPNLKNPIYLQNIRSKNKKTNF